MYVLFSYFIFICLLIVMIRKMLHRQNTIINRLIVTLIITILSGPSMLVVDFLLNRFSLIRSWNEPIFQGFYAWGDY